ncbi:MAG: hypothetical protein K2W95_10325 [Candidatus Obscuribacterales bacterium]|nr:hypothetical protein [Candidatus Obscuribacterales bacterium]
MSDTHPAGGLPHALTTQSPLKQVWNLFLPLLLYYVISSLVGITDMYLAGDLGSEAQAAVGIGDQVIFLVVALGTGLCTACSSFVSRAIGAGDHKRASEYARDSLLLAAIIGLAAGLAGIVFAEALMEALKCSTALKAHAVPYIQICSLANWPFVTFMCQSAVLRALGKADRGAMIGVVSTIVSIVGSLFVFYAIPEPLGHSLSSLAAAWIFGAFAGMFYGIYLLNQHLTASQSSMRDRAVRLVELARTAIPAVGGEFAFIASNFYRYSLIAGIPSSESLQAAWTIRLKVEETVAILPLMALACAVAVVVGHQIGARKGKDVGKLCCQIASIATLLMLILGTVLAAGAELIAGVFTSDAAALKSAIILLQPSPILLPACAIWFVLSGGLDGAGNTKTTGFLNSIDAVGGRIMLSAICIGNGVAGLAFASTVSSVITASFALILFFRFFRKFASIPRTQRKTVVASA